MPFGALGCVEDDVLEHLTKLLKIDEFKLKEHADEENKPLVELDLSKCDTSWCLFPISPF
jgi:hypothetical protein